MRIEDDPRLLEAILQGARRSDGIYAPGPYWEPKTRVDLRQIRRHGISNFRGNSASIGRSFTDSVYVDTRPLALSAKGRIASGLLNRAPFRIAFDRQVSLTKLYWLEWRRCRDASWSVSGRVEELLAKYTMPESTAGGCVDTFTAQGKSISALYLQMLDTHDRLSHHVDYRPVHHMLEIGGGFGAYVHLLISNYETLRKVLYVDIAPNLYIGTQYLRSAFGSAVKTFLETKDLKSIHFSRDSDLEILCILPSQLPRFVGSIDLFHNANSFVEMPTPVINNYARIAESLLSSSGAITLVSYDGYDQHTLEPDQLPGFFSRNLKSESVPTLTPGRFNFHFVGSA